MLLQWSNKICFPPPSAPCQPTNFTAHVDCGTNKGNFSWTEESGAGSYTVEVAGEHGHEASCSSNDTSCSVKLHCGRSYSATLVASTESCHSSKHADIHFDSGKIWGQTAHTHLTQAKGHTKHLCMKKPKYLTHLKKNDSNKIKQVQYNLRRSPKVNKNMMVHL